VQHSFTCFSDIHLVLLIVPVFQHSTFVAAVHPIMHAG
jgi:hypothetical protein